MSLAAYLRSVALEYVLLLACAWALSVTVMEGFWVDEALRFGPATGCVCALVLAACFAAAWRPATRTAGAIGVAVLCVAVLGASLALSGGENPWADSVENYFAFSCCAVLCALACFLLSRTVLGSGALFVACALACSLMQAFYEKGLVALSVVVLVSSLSLVIWRNCSVAMANADSARRVSRPVNFLTAVVPVAACAGAALLVWFAFIAPLSPGVLRLELITDYRMTDQMLVKGVSQLKMRFDTSATSKNLQDGEPFTTDDLKIDPRAGKEVPAKAVPKSAQAAASGGGDASGSSEDESSGASAGKRDVLDKESTDRTWDAMSYLLEFPFAIVGVVIAALLVAAVVAYFVLRRVRRGRRLERFVNGGSARDQAESIYLFLLPRMERIGFSVPEGATLSAWSRSSRRSMDGLAAETKVPFDVLTQTYVKCAYGDYEPTDDEIAPFVGFYDGFWKAARAHLGNFRYFFKSFRLG